LNLGREHSLFAVQEIRVEWCRYMPHRIADRRSSASLAALMLGAVALLGGCATSADSSLTVFADPGKYQYSNCEQLARQQQNWSAREQKLRQLMDRAEQGAGGAVVNVLAYKADYVAATEELKVLEKATRSKNCAENWGSSSAIR
jgi:hypothetical protein